MTSDIRPPIDWTGIREIRTRQEGQIEVQTAMDVMFPYKKWEDDPDKIRGNAQRVLEKAIRA